jgi:hypothetical protein
MKAKNKRISGPKRTLAFEAPLALVQQIESAAEQERRTISGMIRQALSEWLDARAGMKSDK